MTEQEIRTILRRQREYFATGATLSREFRAKQLGKLKASLQRHETELNDALQQDLGKSRMEGYMCEIGLTLSELTWMQKHLRGLMREKRVPTPLSQFAARSFRSPSPYGTVLIMSPWNYPVLLTLDPLIDAIAAGNTAVVKPSAYAPATAAVLKMILAGRFLEPKLPREILWIGRSAVWRNIPIRWHCISSVKIKKPRDGSWITAILAAAASTTPSFISPPAPCPSAVWVRAAWEGITAVPDSRPSAIIGVSWTKRHGWICRYGTRGMMRKKRSCCGGF